MRNSPNASQRDDPAAAATGEAAIAEPATATELDALDEADALVAMPDADFVRMLRSEIDAFVAERAATPPVERGPWDKPVRVQPRRKQYKRGFAK